MHSFAVTMKIYTKATRAGLKKLGDSRE